MADSDWKKRTGIEINFSSDDDDRSDETDDSSPLTEEGSIDALLRDFEQLGTTPPRTRILRRSKISKEHKENSVKKWTRSGSGKSSKGSPCLSQVSSFDSDADFTSEPKRRVNKHNMQRLRASERDLKLDITITSDSKQDRAESLPTIKVESSNRFLSLSCKLVKTATQWRRSQPEGGKSRSDFHEKFCTLVKSGNTESKDKNYRRQLSIEEDLWQAELKDLIWLELQAWHADRSPTEQDKYLCEARQMIPQLLIDILHYRFIKRADQYSSQSQDSGIHLPTPESESPGEETCSGCLWLFCPTCIEHENNALRDVEGLMTRLESAEALYPSSRAFGSQYPLYTSNEFISRVKAMCLWYNVTRHHRLKLVILGKQLLSYSQGNDPDGKLHNKLDISQSNFNKPRKYNFPETNDTNGVSLDFYNIQSITVMGRYLNKLDSDHTQSYRKYIEDVLKIRGLRKALHFLEQLHLTVLRKARISLEKLQKDEDSHENEDEDDSELRRFGHWSPEAKSLDLPSYRPAFLFISRIPLDVIHEFLRMRLETKLEKPSALSIRQLIKELKEGLRLAVLHKERYLQHVNTALIDDSTEIQEIFMSPIVAFDKSVQSVLELYLKYLEQWVYLTQQEKLQKNLLEEEWKFITATAQHIPGGQGLAGSTFCNAASSMLSSINNQFREKVKILSDELISTELDLSLKQSVLLLCRELQSLCTEMRDRTLRVISLAKTLSKYFEENPCFKCIVIKDSLTQLKGKVLCMSECIKEVILLVQDNTQKICLEEADSHTIQSRCREVLHQMYKFAFEYHKEVFRFSNGEEKCHIAREMIAFSQQWLQFVTIHCEKGRGVRPRWANHGLDFLVTVTDPKFTIFLSDKDFESFRKQIDNGIAHIMGAATPTPVLTTSHSYISTRARSSSPSPNITTNQHKISFPNLSDILTLNGDANKQPIFAISDSKRSDSSREDRLQRSVSKLDRELDRKLRSADLIGAVLATTTPRNEKHHILPRPVNFGWQRGIKIGQGRFGKVYTAVNNDTGELLAMKEISLQSNDLWTIRNVATELKIFEGIQHPNLVRYYGAEIHREELMIFMELCTEGTLESLVAATEFGLPEGLVRRYSSQLVSAISALHQHSIVHRDIKTANIFLTAEGNCLKVGDFGSAVKIKAHTTVPGELRGFVGTQAYMAPEVFMQNHSEGHGRAVDIWSLGCVVIEMASGKRPWHEYDSNYQIIFKVGMGGTPEIPSSLSEEGKIFISQCLRHNPKERATTLELQYHTFLKEDIDEECLSCTMPSILEDYLKLGIKR